MKITTYSEKKFRKEILVIRKILKNRMVLLNGGALFCYTKDYKIKRRFATDIDIATDIPIRKLNKLLLKLGVENWLINDPIKLWGLKYCEPCLTIIICGSPIMILNKSTIKNSHGQTFHIDFFKNKYFKTRISKTYKIKIAGLEFLDLVKEFQSRKTPKQDSEDRKLIIKLSRISPRLLDTENLNKLKMSTRI